MSQSKMSRLLRLLMMLNSVKTYSMDELKDRFEMSESTLYRYLDTFEEAGFIINRNGGLYNLKKEDKNVKELNKLFHFSEEEAYILYQTLSLLEKSSPVKEKLINKLHTLYDFKNLAAAKQNSRIEIISKITKAIEDKKQLAIIAYRSSNSDNISNRKVEPFAFLDEHAAIWCFDTADKQCKQFRLARMENVDITQSLWAYQEKHIIPFCDAFRMSSEKAIGTVEAILSLKAYNLLIEEFPLSIPYIHKKEKGYILSLPVANYHGIGRFVLGLLGEITVLEPKEFLGFLEEKKNNFSTVIS